MTASEFIFQQDRSPLRRESYFSDIVAIFHDCCIKNFLDREDFFVIGRYLVKISPTVCCLLF